VPQDGRVADRDPEAKAVQAVAASTHHHWLPKVPQMMLEAALEARLMRDLVVAAGLEVAVVPGPEGASAGSVPESGAAALACWCPQEPQLKHQRPLLVWLL